MSCVWPKATEVREYVKSLARKRGLVLFDPQANRVNVPEHFQLKRPGFFRRLFHKSADFSW
jgi:hypothetical protein